MANYAPKSHQEHQGRLSADADRRREEVHRRATELLSEVTRSAPKWMGQQLANLAALLKRLG